MKCPKCNALGLTCIDSRPYNETIKRRRKCLNCGYRFSTVEIGIDDYSKLKEREADAADVLSELEAVLGKVIALKEKNKEEQDGK